MLSRRIFPGDIRTVAILPFDDLSPNADLQWLANGFASELARQIGSLKGFNVLPQALVRDSSIDELSGDVVLAIDGTTQAHGDTVTVHLELIDVPNREQVWSESFTGKHTDPFDLQRRMTARIARYFNATLEQTPGPI